MSLTKSKNLTENYSARICRIENLKKHPNADRLLIANINNRSITVGINVKVGDLGVFCPLESRLSLEFLSKFNLFRDKLKNSDPEKGGFFENDGRVKCLKLRNIVSEGYWFDLSLLSEFSNMSVEELNACENESFDTVNGIEFIEKYEHWTQQEPSTNSTKNKKNKPVPDQFKFHFNTSHFVDNLHKLTNNSVVYITSKLHGTSFVCGNLYVPRKLTIIDKLAQLCGVKVQKSEYSIVASSRTVIKDESTKDKGFYEIDIWTLWRDRIAHKLQKGITIYGEIVGYLPTGKWIQKGYDYELPNNTSTLYVYRITQTNLDGEVVELSWNAVKDYCNAYQLQHVPELKSLIWKEEEISKLEFCENLKISYLEKILPNGMPDEGICVRIDEGLSVEIFKMKSKLFYLHETKELDQLEIMTELKGAEVTVEEW